MARDPRRPRVSDASPAKAVRDAALDWLARGLGFADALHLASASSARSFAIFDLELAKRAREVTGTVDVTVV